MNVDVGEGLVEEQDSSLVLLRVLFGDKGSHVCSPGPEHGHSNHLSHVGQLQLANNFLKFRRAGQKLFQKKKKKKKIKSFFACLPPQIEESIPHSSFAMKCPPPYSKKV